MDEEMFCWQPFDKGLYVACSNCDNFIGFAFTSAYIPSEGCFQVMLHIGTFALAVGWEFDGKM